MFFIVRTLCTSKTNKLLFPTSLSLPSLHQLDISFRCFIGFRSSEEGKMGSESIGSSFHVQPNPNPVFLLGKKSIDFGSEDVRGISPNRFTANVSPKDICYSCKQPGHWAKDCPNRVNKSPGVVNVSMNNTEFPKKQCPCGKGTCLILMSKTEKNPGRKFYKCPVSDQNSGCRFFEWCDIAILNQKQTVPIRPESSNPWCSCGAGEARLYPVRNGANAGRQFYGCHISKGQGACDFFQWYDDPPVTSQSSNQIPENKLLQDDSSIPGDQCEPKTPIGYRRETHNIEHIQVKKFGSDYGTLDVDPPPVQNLNISGTRGSNERHRVCFNCGEEGHWVSQCTSLQID